MPETGPVSADAPGKINPYLRVVARRDDGYHDVETILLPIDLVDRVTVTVTREARFEVRVTGPRAEGVPLGSENLAVRAAREFVAETGVEGGAEIAIEKQVPVAAGLGGGSADAAAVLRLLDRASGKDLAPEALARIAARVGSDVPALLLQRPALASGRGERAVAIDAAPTWWALVTFDAGIRAEEAYGWWDHGVRRWFERPRPVDEALRAVAGGDPSEISATMYNSLEPGVLHRHPSVAAARDSLNGAGAIGVIVSGSGPTLAALCRGETHAREVAGRVGGFPVTAAPPG